MSKDFDGDDQAMAFALCMVRDLNWLRSRAEAYRELGKEIDAPVFILTAERLEAVVEVLSDPKRYDDEYRKELEAKRKDEDFRIMDDD